jgi:hypothetical protein
VLVTVIDKCVYFDLLLAMKRRKPTKSAKARLVQETIDKAQPGNNNELRQNDTTSKLPSADRKRELFDQLRDLLSLVDKAFTDPDRPYFPDEVFDKLLITIGELQLYIGKKSDYRAPFWKCVKAVNHAQPRLRLIWRLDRLVARACRLPPSPLEKLEELQQQKQLKAHESGFIDEIKKAIGTYSDDPVPADVVRWAPVLKRVNSHQHETKVKALGPNTSHIMGYPEVRDFVAFTSWLDFAYQSMKWRERVWPALKSFLPVVVQLENEDYFRQVFSGPVPNAQSMKKEMARGKALWRQRERRLR